MLLPVAVSIVSVALGAALALWGTDGKRAVRFLHLAAVVLAVGVVLLELLPSSIGAVGWWAIVPFLVALALPVGFERLVHAHPGRHSAEWSGAEGRDLGLELGYVGLVWHKVADGIGVAAFGGGEAHAHGHDNVVWAIAAHTVPMTAMVVYAFRGRCGMREALLRAAGLAAAMLVGVVVTDLVPVAWVATWEPWITAAMSGFLLHVVFHDWRPGHSDVTKEPRSK